MMSFLSEFVIWDPICMSIIWMVGAIVFYICIESKQILSRDETPFVSILIPCYNEEQTIRETIYHVMKQKYPHYEVIVINDGSTDQTVPIVKQLIGKYPNLRCVNVKKILEKPMHYMPDYWLQKEIF